MDWDVQGEKLSSDEVKRFLERERERPRADLDEIRITVTPRAHRDNERVGPGCTYTHLVDRRTGSEGLFRSMRFMCDEMARHMTSGEASDE